jgi:hypothetical protein
MEMCIVVTGLKVKDKVMVSNIGQMELNILDNGLKMKHQDKEHLFTTMAIIMKVNEKMIKLMGWVLMFMLIIQNILVNGKMINNMDKEKKLGQMVLNTLVHIEMEKKMGKDNFSLEMDQIIMDNSYKMIFKDLAATNGLIKESTKVNGLLIK